MRHGSKEFSDITGLEPSYQIWALVEIKGLILMQPNNWCCGQFYWIDFLIWTADLLYIPMKLANCQVFLLCWTYKKTQQTKKTHVKSEIRRTNIHFKKANMQTFAIQSEPYITIFRFQYRKIQNYMTDS